jgi:hypothetical protein
LAAIIFIGGFFTLDRWKTTLYYGDSGSYYLHVVSAFVNQDVGDYDKTITTLKEVHPNADDQRKVKHGIRPTKTGRMYIKYTLGVPMMETPFFFLGHIWASFSNQYEANGWTRPYLLAVGLSTIAYLLLGLHLLLLLLREHFKPLVVTLTILSLILATNLFFHATYVTMAHGFLFFDYCLLLYLTVRFHKNPSWLKALGIGAVVGLIAITRVPEVISLLIPLLWGVVSWKTFQERITFFVKHYYYLILAGVGLLMVFSPQLMYWYYVSSELYFNPYEGEGFNFFKPQIHKGFLHFSNGWLIYTPIMIFSLLGWWLLPKYYPKAMLSILIFVGLHAYIHYCYYAWTFFPGLGQRPMVETYPLLAFCLAAFYSFCWQRKWAGYLSISALFFFAWLNLFQTWQMKEGVIWSERGNAAFYWETFGTLHGSLNSLRAYDSKEFQADTNKIKFVKRLIFDGFEDTQIYSDTRDSILVYKGKYSNFDLGEFPMQTKRIKAGPDIKPNDWLLIGIHAYMKGEHRLWARDQCMILVLEIFDEQQNKIKGASVKLSSYIGNDTYSIWSAGEIDQWGEASFFIKIPKGIQPNWEIKGEIFNPHGQKVFLDNFYLDLYRRK